MRVPVVEPPPPGAPRLPRAPLVVAAFDWFDPKPVCTVIVKVTYSFASGALKLAPEPRPFLMGDALSEREELAGEMHEPWDFAPHKPKADVLLVGDAHADSAKPRNELVARISVGSLARGFRLIPAAPARRVPLGARALFREEQPEHLLVGPRAVDADFIGSRAFRERFDYAIFNVAPPEQQRDYFEPGEPIVLAGLSARGEIALEVPREAPRVLVVWKDSRGRAELQMVADTLWIDAAAEACVLVFRGMISSGRAGGVDRICVALEPEGSARPWDQILRSAARGSFTVSAEPEDASHAPRSRVEIDRLTMARYQLATQATPPEPTLSLEAYTRVSAEMAEKREPRADVLARHKLDEDAWLLEERAWLQTMASRAMAGDGSVAARFGELFLAAQDALATPSEMLRTLADYAMIVAAIEVAEDLTSELSRRGLRLTEWLRLDRRMKASAAEDAGVRGELARLVGSARITLAAQRGRPS